MSDQPVPTEPWPSPRDRLRARHDQQLALLSTFAGFDAKMAKARRALDALETEQRATLGELAAATSVDVAADLTGLPAVKVRDALAEQRRSATGADTRGAGR